MTTACDLSPDRSALRRALGQFATGVTIVTTVDAALRPVGVTANSFGSLSLEPALVVWSLAKNAGAHGAFCAAAHFAVHVLGADQVALSQRFAARGIDKFDGIDWRPGRGGVPLIDGCAARFVCRTHERLAGGDHTLFVGELCAIDTAPRRPLVFHAGAYTTLAPSP